MPKQPYIRICIPFYFSRTAIESNNIEQIEEELKQQLEDGQTQDVAEYVIHKLCKSPSTNHNKPLSQSL